MIRAPLPPAGRCVVCGGILRNERWRCWLCVLMAMLIKRDRYRNN